MLICKLSMAGCLVQYLFLPVSQNTANAALWCKGQEGNQIRFALFLCFYGLAWEKDDCTFGWQMCQ